MKNIIISYSKDQKNIAKKLVSKLESDGFTCWIEPRDLQGSTDKNKAFTEAVNNAQIMILIFSTLADKTEELILQYDTAFDKEKKIIPFIVTDVEKSLTVQYFLNTHDWINAYDASFEDATTNLIDLIQKETNVVAEKNIPKSQNKVQSSITNNSKKNYAIVGISLIVLIIIGIILFAPDNSTKWENIIVGKWKLVEYQDNLQRTGVDSIDYFSMVENLKNNFSITFFKDKKFERIGFQPQTEKGSWTVDEQNKKLKLQAADKKDVSDELAIESLTSEKLIIVVAENVANNQQVVTKLTLKKEK